MCTNILCSSWKHSKSNGFEQAWIKKKVTIWWVLDFVDKKKVRGRIMGQNAYGNSLEFGIRGMFLGFKLWNPKKGIFGNLERF